MSIAALERKIQQFSNTGKLLQRAREAMAKEAVRLSKEGFAKSQNPYGKPWRPLKYRAGKPLVLTGALSGFTYRVTDKGFIVYAGAKYFDFHQYVQFGLQKIGSVMTPLAMLSVKKKPSPFMSTHPLALCWCTTAT